MPWLAPAPFFFDHEDKNEDDRHAQENQRPDPPPAGSSTPLVPWANACEINILTFHKQSAGQSAGVTS